MFEIGFSEIVLILGLALLVLGPEKLPGLAQKVGRWTGRARAMARQLRTQLEQEVTMEEMAKSKPMQAPKQETPAPAAPTSDPYSGGLHPDAPLPAEMSGHDTSAPAADPMHAPYAEPAHEPVHQPGPEPHHEPHSGGPAHADPVHTVAVNSGPVHAEPAHIKNAQ
jgi:sec-independent protein translocase protein TatB